MKKCMEKLNNKGSSMILVIVAIAFIGIICSLVLTMTMTNVQMKTTDKSSKRNFYGDETAVNEVTAGLEEYSCESMEFAYAWLIKNYATASIDTKQRYKDFSKIYMEKLSQKLHGSGTGLEINYNAGNLKNMIKTFPADATVTSATGGTYGTIFHSMDAAGNNDYRYLTLKDVVITYKDSHDYETTITTDINMEVPVSGGIDATFAKYALISDELIKVTAKNEATGGVYAGGLKSDINSEGGGDTLNPNMGGIWTHSDAGKFTINGNGNNVITRESIIASNKSSMVINNANVWAKNLITIGISGSASDRKPILHINGETKVEDDLTIKANYSNIKLEGQYYGFSYKNKDAVTKVSTADTSSAVNVNAQKVQMDLSNADKFVLFGRSFVSSGAGEKIKNGDKMDDILTGQSISVKNDQSMYLIPTDKYLKIASNPIVLNDLNQYAQDTYNTSSTYSDLNLKTDIVDFTAGTAKDIYDKYLDPVTPLKAIYYNQNTGISSYQFINYYYNFKNENAANKFAQEYYTANETKMQEIYNKFYSGTQFRINPTFKRFDIAGNALVKKNGVFEFKHANLTVMKNESKHMKEQYKSVQLNLRENGSTAADLDTTEYVDSIVNIDAVINNPTVIEAKDDHTVKVIITNATDYEIPDSGKGIIIASGNVTLGKKLTWEGVIIANGKIILDKEGTFIANETLVMNALNYCLDHGNSLKNYLYAYSSSAAGRVGDNAVNYENAISFENWKKN